MTVNQLTGRFCCINHTVRQYTFLDGFHALHAAPSAQQINEFTYKQINYLKGIRNYLKIGEIRMLGDDKEVCAAPEQVSVEHPAAVI